MFSLLQNRHPLTILFLIPLAGALTFIHFWFSNTSETIHLELFQKSVILKANELFLIYGGVLAMNSMLLSYTFNRLNLVDYFNQVIGLFYMLLISAFVPLSQLDILFAQFSLLLGVIFLLQVKNNVDAKSAVFNATFFISLAGTLNFFHFTFLVLPFFVLARTRSFVFREYLMVLLGLALVVAYYLFFLYFYQLPWPHIFQTSGIPLHWTNIEIIKMVVVVFLVGLAMITRSRTVGSPGIRIERIVKILFSGILIGVLPYIAAALFKMNVHFIGSMFVALYVGYSYQFSKVKWLYNFLGYIILAAVILEHLALI